MYIQIFWRFVDLFEDWPFFFVSAAHASHNADTFLECVRQFYASHECCLESFFCIPVRRTFPTEQSLVDATGFWTMIVTWGKKGKVTNVHLERLLAAFKAAAKMRSSDTPSMTRVVDSGELSQFLHEHLKAGGRNPVAFTRDTLLEEGVPLRAAKKRRRAPAMVRKEMVYANAAYADHRRESGPLKAEARSTFLQDRMD